MTVLHKKAKVSLSDIRRDGGTQQRATINTGTVAEYAEDIKAGAKFPPILLFFDGSDYWLADGFHRFEAIRSLPRRRKIVAEVHEGTQRDAILHSVTVNAQHGLRRSNEDKRKAVETLLNDPEWRKWSDREIARRCSVSDRTVNRVRADLTASLSQLDTPPTDRTYISRHGTPATMNTTRIGGIQTTAPALTPAPDPRPVSRQPTTPAPAPEPHPTPQPCPALVPRTPASAPTIVYGDIEDIDLAQTLLSALRACHAVHSAGTGGYQPDADWWASMPKAVSAAYSLWGLMGYPGLPRSSEAMDEDGEVPPEPPINREAPLPDLIDIEETVGPELFDIIETGSSQGSIDRGRCNTPTHLGGLFSGRYRGVSWVHAGGEYGDDDGTIWLWEALTAEEWGDQRVLSIHGLLHEWQNDLRDPWDFRGLRLRGPWEGWLILGGRRLQLRCPAGLRREGELPIPDEETMWLDWRKHNNVTSDGIRQYTFYSLSQATLARLWRRTQPRRCDWTDTKTNRQLLASAVFARSWSLPGSSPDQIEICRQLRRQELRLSRQKRSDQ